MTEAVVIEISRDAILTMLWVAGPIMLLTLVIGLIISLFQAVTQIQEMTLTFVPKMVVVFVAMILLAPYMIAHMTAFTERVADMIVGLGTAP